MFDQAKQGFGWNPRTQSLHFNLHLNLTYMQIDIDKLN